eukprot:jgi/Tetstr1/460718/TSEL_005905.t1
MYGTLCAAHYGENGGHHPGGNESRAGGQDQHVRAPFAPSNKQHYLDWKTALATALPGFENGIPLDSPRRPGLFPIAFDRVLEYLLGNPRLQPVDEYCYHAACYGAFIAGSTIELRSKLPAVACVTEGTTLAFGRRLEATVHGMEAVDDGHRFRLAYLRKHGGAQMHHGDTVALDVVRERYLHPDTENLGSPEFSELLELYEDRVYDANIASAAKTAARQRFGGALRRNDRDRDGGGGSRDNFKTTRPGREAVAP